MTAHEATRRAWDEASSKHVREYDEHLAQARTATLLPIENELLSPLCREGRCLGRAPAQLLQPDGAPGDLILGSESDPWGQLKQVSP